MKRQYNYPPFALQYSKQESMVSTLNRTEIMKLDLTFWSSIYLDCTFVAQEVRNYYVNNGSKVYSVLLDASQAFDRVDYFKLFKLLLSKGFCPITARLLAFMYAKQQLRVKYCNSVSDHFNVSNVVNRL